ncbi:phosphotransferase [Streptomyces sp. NPDC057245]|uniref:phosphotransferase n=1 Tax=Streptomyces sp. NPDC057245 TaxID=3346065 RepID=UPI003641AF85
MEVIVCNTTCRRHPAASAGVVHQVRDAVLDGTLSRVGVLAADTAADADGPARWPGAVEWTAPGREHQRYGLLAAGLRRGTGSMLVFDCACDIRPGILAAFANLGAATALVTDQPDHPARAAAATRRQGRHLMLDGLNSLDDRDGVLDVGDRDGATVGPNATSGPTGPGCGSRMPAGGPSCPDRPDGGSRPPAVHDAPGRATEAPFNFLGALLLTGAERRLLAGILDSHASRHPDRAAGFPWQDAIGTLARRTRIRCAVLARDVHGDDMVIEGSLAGGSHARTYIRLHSGSGSRTVRKEAVSAGLSKLNDEVSWLHGLETTAGRHFPDIVASRVEPHGVSMDLAYHHLPTLRGLILTGEIDEEEAARWTRRVLAVLRRDVYPAGVRPAPAGYLRRTHLDRIETRLAQTAAALAERHRLWTADSLLVNGVRLRNARALVADLVRDETALRMLTPDRLVRTHGDPHFDNILVDRHNHRFLLIDPRGNAGYDPAYDLGKVWHSVNSLYDLIHAGHVEVAAGADGIDYTFTSPHLVAFYRRIRERVHAWLTATGWHQDDPHWLLKVRFAEAAHMCSVMPFHIAHDQRETVVLACYARGLELINDLHRDLMAARPRARPVRDDALSGPRRTPLMDRTEAVHR